MKCEPNSLNGPIKCVPNTLDNPMKCVPNSLNSPMKCEPNSLNSPMKCVPNSLNSPMKCEPNSLEIAHRNDDLYRRYTNLRQHVFTYMNFVCVTHHLHHYHLHFHRHLVCMSSTFNVYSAYSSGVATGGALYKSYLSSSSGVHFVRLIGERGPGSGDVGVVQAVAAVVLSSPQHQLAEVEVVL